MDETKQDSQEVAWISSQNRVELHEDIILKSPSFSTVIRLLVSGGEGPLCMYNRKMELACPKDAKLVVNMMDDLRNKATNSLKPIRTIFGLNGLFGLHDQIWDKKYKVQTD